MTDENQPERAFAGGDPSPEHCTENDPTTDPYDAVYRLIAKAAAADDPEDALKFSHAAASVAGAIWQTQMPQ